MNMHWISSEALTQAQHVIFRKWLVRIIDINARGGRASEWIYVNYEYKPFSKYFVSLVDLIASL